MTEIGRWLGLLSKVLACAALACLLAGLVLALDAFSGECHETITADYGRCDVGATVSLEMGDRVVCRCPSPGGTITIARPGGAP